MYEDNNYPPIPSLKPANIMYEPKGEKYQTENRNWQGCPSIVKTKGGRLWSAWFSGGVKEPGYGSFNMVAFSDDEGKSWRENYVVIEADEAHFDHSTDVNLWIDPDGNLYVTYIQCRILDKFLPIDQMWTFYDGVWGVWALKCTDPDAENPVFEPPVRWCDGFMRNKPTVLSTGEWLAPAYDWMPPVHVKSDSFNGRGKGEYRFKMRISADKGKTWEVVIGPEKELLASFDEMMVVEGLDKSWHFFTRVSARNGIFYSHSCDRGESWTPLSKLDIPTAETRVFVSRLSSGNVILVHSGVNRNQMLARISTDDCKSWSEPLVIDERNSVSYPDGMEDDEGNIYIIYDRERYGAREILFAKIREEDIVAGKLISDGSFSKKIINKIPEKT